MSQIEDVVYEAYDLGLRDEVFNKVLTLKKEKKHKYTQLSDLYEIALFESKKQLKKVV